MPFVDKIREYIIAGREDGTLVPGKQLPTYHELCRRFSTSYGTVYHAVARCEHEGLIERRNGVGIFLRGADVLNIELDAAILTDPLLEKLQSMADAAQLHLNLIRAPADHTADFAARGSAALLTGTHRETSGNLLDYSVFSDYNNVMSQFAPCMRHGNTEIPFYGYTYQIYANPLLLRRCGLEKEISGAHFKWLHHLISCAYAGKVPLHDYWDCAETGEFFRYIYLFIGMHFANGRNMENLSDGAFFATQEGENLIRLLKSFHFTTERNAFMHETVCNFYAGSWLAVQYQDQFNMSEREMRLIPYAHAGRPVCYLKQPVLRSLVRGDTSESEKHRIWMLVKIMTGRLFQLTLSNATGAVSVRNDVAPEDYTWNTRPDFAGFLPQKNSTVVNGNIFKDHIMMVLSTLLEQAVFYGADPVAILRNCDLKLLRHRPDDWTLTPPENNRKENRP